MLDQISNNGFTVERGHYNPDYEIVFGSCGVKNGDHYWAIRLDAFATEEDIVIGICRKEQEKINFSTPAHEIPSFFGFSPSSGTRISYNK